ncbi:hypothetical protein O5O45_00195 [Hahella aquimaris]|uniref:hypothetical protein n=1 Tax=Hahella sp. HNIBRBA332 TaxID=3015983 RepID=UPI00273BA4B9|nr:hypothetical protein [Hahella sp. HNIBRBA332]WLQ14359.1 hypothetical protein O5O45_00195 [Hahella sp. HNIBRBA332]
MIGKIESALDITPVIAWHIELAEVMGVEPLPDGQARRLIMHLLFEETCAEVAGKEGWACYVEQLLTASELKLLLFFHFYTRLLAHNGVRQYPVFQQDVESDLLDKLDQALFSKRITAH